MCIYIYIFIVYFSPFLYLSLKVCHYCCSAVVVVLFFFLSLSLLFLSCVAYGTVVLVPLTLLVSLLCCELIQSGVVGSGWSFPFSFFSFFFNLSLSLLDVLY